MVGSGVGRQWQLLVAGHGRLPVKVDHGREVRPWPRHRLRRVPKRKGRQHQLGEDISHHFEQQRSHQRGHPRFRQLGSHQLDLGHRDEHRRHLEGRGLCHRQPHHVVIWQHKGNAAARERHSHWQTNLGHRRACVRTWLSVRTRHCRRIQLQLRKQQDHEDHILVSHHRVLLERALL